MSGRNIPYQLRTHKAIERHLFIDLLHWLDRALRFEHGYEYIGMGGPFLEDFKQLHQRFPNLPMTSIEIDSQVAKRQRFNKPHCGIRFRVIPIGRYINSCTFPKKLIAWLDYTKPSEMRQQIDEFTDLILKSPPVSVLKITLNAQYNGLMRGADSAAKRIEREKKLRTDFRHLPLEWLSADDVSETSYPKTIYRIFRDQVKKRLENHSDIEFRPLSSFVYADGQAMLTVTGIVGSPAKLELISKASRLNRWEFYGRGWAQTPKEIAVPELSSRERLFIQQLLPSLVRTGSEIASRLKFRIADEQDESNRLLQHYAKFYRQFPHFERLLGG